MNWYPGGLLVIPPDKTAQLPAAAHDFFFSSMADVALWLGPYMSISSKNVICTKTQKVRKCRQITTNQKHTNQPDDPQIPQPDLRFVKEEQQTRHTKGARAQQKHPQRGFAKGHSGLTTASRSKTCQNELSTNWLHP